MSPVLTIFPEDLTRIIIELAFSKVRNILTLSRCGFFPRRISIFSSS
jgi:hypothetical protein